MAQQKWRQNLRYGYLHAEPTKLFFCGVHLLFETFLTIFLWNPGSYRHQIVRLSSAQFGLVMGVVFFLQTNFDFLTSHFDGIFLYHSKCIVVLSLNLKKIVTCDCFLSNIEVSILQFGQFGTITARYISRC